MSDSSPPHRAASSGRKGSRKVRTGCITCKVRKVKCDEAKPFCMRCLKSGRKCDGYLDPSIMASRRKSSRDKTGSSPYSSFSTLLEWALPEEKRSFHFFQQVTAPHLAGDLDAIFWKVLVLQVCQTEPCVRHAVLAVSSLHESLMLGTQHAPHLDAGSKHSFALQQYNKAIACLLGQMTDTTAKPLAPLLTCVLFVCLEFMHGKDKESLIHLEQGRQILSKLERKAYSNDPEIGIIKRHLVPIYLRLSVTSFLFGGKPVPIPQSLKTLQDIPTVFDSVQEIRFALYDFMDEALRFTQNARQARYGSNVPAETFTKLGSQKEQLLRRLSKFNVAFSLYQVSKPTHMSEVSSAVFQMYLHTMGIWIATALSQSEACFDDHLSAFSAVIPLAATIINSESATMGREFRSRAHSHQAHAGATIREHERGYPHQRRSMFTFETYVIPVLYYVATKCRHPLIRHSALDLLKQNPHRRENLWRSKRMAAIAEHIIRVEEGSAPIQPGSPTNMLLGEFNEDNNTNDPDPSMSGGSAGSEEPLFPIHPSLSLLLPTRDGQQMSAMMAPYHDLVPAIEHPARNNANNNNASSNNNNNNNNNNPASRIFMSPRQQQVEIEMEGATLLGLEDLDLDIPIDPSLMLDADGNISGAASFCSGDDNLCGAGGGAGDMSGFLAPSPLLQPTSTTVSRASSVTSHGGSIHIPDWPPRPDSSGDGSDRSSSGGSPDYHGGNSGGITMTSPMMGIQGHQQQQQHQQHHQQQHLYHYQRHLQNPHHQYHSLPMTQQHQQQQQQQHSQPARHCSTEAPFNIPEHIRVHDVIIGPEKDDGSWLTVFRKLHGPSEDWSVHTEYVMA